VLCAVTIPLTINLIFVDPCIVSYSGEIATRCNFVCPLSLGNDRSPYGHINQRLQIQFRAPDDEQRAARNMLSL